MVYEKVSFGEAVLFRPHVPGVKLSQAKHAEVLELLCRCIVG